CDAPATPMSGVPSRSMSAMVGAPPRPDPPSDANVTAGANTAPVRVSTATEPFETTAISGAPSPSNSAPDAQPLPLTQEVDRTVVQPRDDGQRIRAVGRIEIRDRHVAPRIELNGAVRGVGAEDLTRMAVAIARARERAQDRDSRDRAAVRSWRIGVRSNDHVA